MTVEFSDGIRGNAPFEAFPNARSAAAALDPLTLAKVKAAIGAA